MARNQPRPTHSTNASAPTQESDLLDRLAVFGRDRGSTGRTGRYVVEELLSRNVPILAMVRDIDRANDVLLRAEEIVVKKQIRLC